MRHLFVLMAAFVFLTGPAPRAFASEWGCEVLLCAASSNPSWRGVDTCIPPMERLLSAMKKPGFSWPTCPDGGAGKPGYVAYLDCPAGWRPTASRSGSGETNTSEQSQCMRQITNCSGGSVWSESAEAKSGAVSRVYFGDDQCSYTEYQDRPLRSEPYFFDIKDDTTGQSERHWFSLSR
jgi:hypothetical protein